MATTKRMSYMIKYNVPLLVWARLIRHQNVKEKPSNKHARNERVKTLD